MNVTHKTMATETIVRSINTKMLKPLMMSYNLPYN